MKSKTFTQGINLISHDLSLLSCESLVCSTYDQITASNEKIKSPFTIHHENSIHLVTNLLNLINPESIEPKKQLDSTPQRKKLKNILKFISHLIDALLKNGDYYTSSSLYIHMISSEIPPLFSLETKSDTKIMPKQAEKELWQKFSILFNPNDRFHHLNTVLNNCAKINQFFIPPMFIIRNNLLLKEENISSQLEEYSKNSQGKTINLLLLHHKAFIELDIESKLKMLLNHHNNSGPLKTNLKSILKAKSIPDAYFFSQKIG
jgi:hypothetical protein